MTAGTTTMTDEVILDHHATEPDVAAASAIPTDPWWLTAYTVLRSFVLTVAAAIGVICILVFGASLAFGVKPLVVLSGSMEPTLPVGSVVFARTVEAAAVAPGDIVTTDRGRNLGLVTHRVVSLTSVGEGYYDMVMRGDANTSDDPRPYRVREVGQYVAHVPAVGMVAMALRTTQGIALVVSAFLLLAMFFILDPARLRSQPHPTAS